MKEIKEPLISIIIPIYNVEKYVDKAIQSVINQTFQDIEIICIDDCSNDNSIRIIERYAKLDNRIKILYHNKNKGVSSARNTGLGISKAKYLMFLDPDDSFCPTICKEMLNKVHGENLDLVMCDTTILIENRDTDNRGFNNSNNYANKDFMVVWNKIWRKDIINKYNLRFPEGRIGEDAYFSTCYYNIITNSKVGIINKKLHNYLIRNDSIMGLLRNLDNEQMFDAFFIAEATYKFFKKNNILSKVYPRYFGFINYGIKSFSEKNYDRIANILYSYLKPKTEIEIREDCFLIEKKEYRINKKIFNKVYELNENGLK